MSARMSPFYPVAACRCHKHRRRQREGEEGGQRSGSHCSEVAQPASETAMTYGFGGVEVSEEVPAFKRKVGGDKNFAAGGGA